MRGGIPEEKIVRMKGSKANAMPPATVQKHGDGPKGGDYKGNMGHGKQGKQITLTTAGTLVDFKGSPKGPPRKSLPKPLYGMPTPA